MARDTLRAKKRKLKLTTSARDASLRARKRKLKLTAKLTSG